MAKESTNSESKTVQSVERALKIGIVFALQLPRRRDLNVWIPRQITQNKLDG